MVDKDRQAPGANAPAWSTALAEIGCPVLSALRLSDRNVRVALAAHLVDIGAVSSAIAAERIAAAARVKSARVIW